MSFFTMSMPSPPTARSSALRVMSGSARRSGSYGRPLSAKRTVTLGGSPAAVQLISASPVPG